MKKCYWCAEEIQDEAKICRYCGRDVINAPLLSNMPVEDNEPDQNSSKTNSEANPNVNLAYGKFPNSASLTEIQELPRLKWHQQLFWRSVFFGIGMGILLFYYVTGSTLPSGLFGYSGYFSNALLQGCSNVVIYTVIYFFLGSIYRGAIRKIKYANLEVRQSIIRSEFAFVVGVIFLMIIALIGVEKVFVTVGDKSVTAPAKVITPNVAMIQTANVTPTKRAATPTQNVPTTDLVNTQQERELTNSLQLLKTKQGMKERGWIFQEYLDDLKVDIFKTSITITLSKSPETEEKFKTVASQLIYYTAILTVGEKATIVKRGNSLDFVVTSIRVISENMADYTIAGHIEKYNNITELIEDKSWELVKFEKYYEVDNN